MEGQLLLGMAQTTTIRVCISMQRAVAIPVNPSTSVLTNRWSLNSDTTRTDPRSNLEINNLTRRAKDTTKITIKGIIDLTKEEGKQIMHQEVITLATICMTRNRLMAAGELSLREAGLRVRKARRHPRVTSLSAWVLWKEGLDLQTQRTTILESNSCPTKLKQITQKRANSTSNKSSKFSDSTQPMTCTR